jgi:hypothetical protein
MKLGEQVFYSGFAIAFFGGLFASVAILAIGLGVLAVGATLHDRVKVQPLAVESLPIVKLDKPQ